jgi:hypothetical protein
VYYLTTQSTVAEKGERNLSSSTLADRITPDRSMAALANISAKEDIKGCIVYTRSCREFDSMSTLYLDISVIH